MPGNGSSGPTSSTGPSTAAHSQPARRVTVARGWARRSGTLRARPTATRANDGHTGHRMGQDANISDGCVHRSVRQCDSDDGEPMVGWDQSGERADVDHLCPSRRRSRLPWRRRRGLLVHAREILRTRAVVGPDSAPVVAVPPPYPCWLWRRRPSFCSALRRSRYGVGHTGDAECRRELVGTAVRRRIRGEESRWLRWTKLASVRHRLASAGMRSTRTTSRTGSGWSRIRACRGAEAATRLAADGPNALPVEQPPSPLRRFLAEYTSYMQLILVGAAIVSLRDQAVDHGHRAGRDHALQRPGRAAPGGQGRERDECAAVDDEGDGAGAARRRRGRDPGRAARRRRRRADRGG